MRTEECVLRRRAVCRGAMHHDGSGVPEGRSCSVVGSSRQMPSPLVSPIETSCLLLPGSLLAAVVEALGEEPSSILGRECAKVTKPRRCPGNEVAVAPQIRGMARSRHFVGILKFAKPETASVRSYIARTHRKKKRNLVPSRVLMDHRYLRKHFF